MIPKFKNKKFIIFDLDGVIFDSVGFVRDHMKNKYQGMTEEDFKAIFIENFWIGLNNFKEIAKVKYIINEEYSRDRNTDKNKNVLLFEGTRELLEKISSNYKVVINSSDHQERIIERLNNNNIYNFFDFIAGKEISQNKVEKFNLILKKFKLLPEEVIFITDTIGDVAESDKAGIESIAVTWGVHSRDDFEKQSLEKLVLIVDDINTLINLF